MTVCGLVPVCPAELAHNWHTKMAHQHGQGAGDGLSYAEAAVGQRHLSNLTKP